MSIVDARAMPSISILGNGLQVATIHVASELTTSGIWVRSGCLYETAQNNGAAHFLEHLLFRGNSVYDKSALEYLTERTGINIQAATSRVHTGFWAQSEVRQVPAAIDVICQMVLNPTITAEAVERRTPDDPPGGR
jgi:processing peptidase subunit beta